VSVFLAGFVSVALTGFVSAFYSHLRADVLTGVDLLLGMGALCRESEPVKIQDYAMSVCLSKSGLCSTKILSQKIGFFTKCKKIYREFYHS
jgi:hypothetical protein